MSKRNRCGHLHRSAQQPPPPACFRLQFCSDMFFFFCLARWDAQLTNNPHTCREEHSHILWHPVLEVMVNYSHIIINNNNNNNELMNNKEWKQTKPPRPLPSPTVYHVITTSIHPTINPRFGADSRWFKILNQTQSHVTDSGKAKTRSINGSSLTTVAHWRSGMWGHNWEKSERKELHSEENRKGQLGIRGW